MQNRRMKALSIALMIGGAWSMNAAALTIDWAAFKATDWTDASITVAQKNALAEALYIVVRDQALYSNKAVSFGNPPSILSGGDATGFYALPEIKSNTCTPSYTGTPNPTSVGCLITGAKMDFGTIPENFPQATNVSWLAETLAAVDAAGGNTALTLNSYVTALSAALARSTSDGLSGKVYLGNVGYFTVSASTGSVGFTGASIGLDLADIGRGIRPTVLPGITIDSEVGLTETLGHEIRYNPATHEAQFKAAGDTGFGVARAINGTLVYQLQSATATKYINVTVDVAKLPPATDNLQMRAIFRFSTNPASL